MHPQQFASRSLIDTRRTYVHSWVDETLGLRRAPLTEYLRSISNLEEASWKPLAY